MSEILKFKCFCIEVYKEKKQITGKAVIDLFTQFKVLEYIEKFYEELHSYGDKFICEDIDAYIEARM